MAYESMRDIMADAPAHVGKPKLLCRNTVEYTKPDGTQCVRLHHTDIIERKPDGRTVLTTGGWRTVTTKDRLNAYNRAGAHISSTRGIWYVSANGETVPFFDGVTVRKDGTLTKPKADIVRKQDKLGKQIAAFVKRLDQYNGKPLPQPNGGDCWFCAMHTGDGGSLGDTFKDTEHLRSHVAEGYLHGSLLVNAMRWAGYPDTSIGLHLTGFDKTHRTVRSALRRYLRRKLELSA